MSDASTSDGSTSNVSEPKRLKRTITMRSFGGVTQASKCLTPSVPGEVYQGVSGRYLGLAQVWGVINSVEVKAGRLPDGTPKESIVCKGQFSYVTLADGEEVDGCAEAYFPSNFSHYVKEVFESPDVTSLEFAIEIGAAPTGKSIPFTYEVRTFVNPAPSQAMARLKLVFVKQKALSAPEVVPAETVAIEPVKSGHKAKAAAG